jgi:hypothetical protein
MAAALPDPVESDVAAQIVKAMKQLIIRFHHMTRPGV